jgi:HTH-type transcriptional regulator, competence development regulator
MTMKFNRDRNWLIKRAEQEDLHFISVGGLISRIDPEWQAEVSATPLVEATKAAFVRLLQLARRERRLTLEALADKADVDLAELVKVETDESFKPTPRTVHQLAAFLKLPAKKLMVLAGLLQVKDFGLQQASVRFAARSEPVEDLTPEEHAAFEEYVKFLNEQ